MRQHATTLILLACIAVGLTLPATAQPVRNGVDVIWARDIEGATITHDGMLDEAVWQQADSLVLTREGTYFVPGGGWEDYPTASLEEPTDPVDATVYFLRDGNTVWIGVRARDKSIGGTRDFFQHDGLVMSIIDQTEREDAYETAQWFNASNVNEFFYTWLSREHYINEEGNRAGRPLEIDTVGAGPFFYGHEELDGAPTEGVWDAMAVVDGVANDDFNGNAEPTEDVGYTMEVWIDVSMLGYDMTDADGDRLPMTIGIYDLDYQWPADQDLAFRTRAWWQNPWGNNMPNGVAFLYGDPTVTVSSGEASEVTEPELRLPSSPDEITLDGSLDEEIWGLIEPQVSLQYQMSEEMLDALPGIGPYYTHWFYPIANADPEGAPEVVDASTAQIRMFYQDNMLYIGLDSDDQAISGQSGEGSADGMRFVMRQPETNTPGLGRPAWQFMVVVDSMGMPLLMQDAARPDTVMAAVSLKGSSTVGDPSDIDEGYQIEMAIDLEALGFPADLGDRLIWIGANYFDGDDLDPAENSYGVRTWWLSERASGPLARTYLDPELVLTDVEEAPGEVPTTIVLKGNYPNPFNPSTTIHYALPQAGRVTLDVFDMLGRRVASLDPGIQQAGQNTFTFQSADLASGVYFYRISVAAGEVVQASAVGRMMLLK